MSTEIRASLIERSAMTSAQGSSRALPRTLVLCLLVLTAAVPWQMRWGVIPEMTGRNTMRMRWRFPGRSRNRADGLYSASACRIFAVR